MLTPAYNATAAHGTPAHHDVRSLPDFRDRCLLAHPPGRVFVELYKQYSTSIAADFLDRKPLRFADSTHVSGTACGKARAGTIPGDHGAVGSGAFARSL